MLEMWKNLFIITEGNTVPGKLRTKSDIHILCLFWNAELDRIVGCMLVVYCTVSNSTHIIL